jgi:hypothetical protein
MKTNFTGWIKPGNYGVHTMDGIEYIDIYPKWAIPVLRAAKFIQKTLWLAGVAVHDPIFGECTPDFNCCCKSIGRKAFIRIGA